MNSADADLRFPVLCFTNQLGMHAATTLAELTTWRSHALKPRQSELGMEIIDSQGQRFAVRAIDPPPIEAPWLKRAFKRLLPPPKMPGRIRSRPHAPISLEQVKTRVLACVRGDPETYCYDADHCPLSIPMPLDEIRAFIDAETIEALIFDGLAEDWLDLTEDYWAPSPPHETYQDTIIKAQSRLLWVDQEEQDRVALYKVQAAARIAEQRQARAAA